MFMLLVFLSLAFLTSISYTFSVKYAFEGSKYSPYIRLGLLLSTAIAFVILGSVVMSHPYIVEVSRSLVQ